jgi:tRNA(Ile)-lysidine synthase
MRLIDRFAAEIKALSPGPAPMLVAVSGGLDSVVLLDLLTETRDRHGLGLVVGHVDHGIHPESARVAQEVESLAVSRGLRFMVGHLGLGAETGETQARAARYRWLREARRDLGARWIVTAHQADDQRETVLMRMLRGSGPAGLAGMRRKERDVLRPLLPFSRQSLARYARRRGLTWWEDPANQDRRHLRCWIRGELLPLLEARLPDLTVKLAETRRHAVHNRRAWDTALRAWPGLDVQLNGGRVSLDWSVLRTLPEPLALALAEALVRAAGGPAGATRVRRALAALNTAPSGSSADLGNGWRLTRDFSRLATAPPRRRTAEPTLSLMAPAGDTRWGAWRVRWRTEPAPARQSRDGSTAWFIPGALTLRAWRPGDRLAPLGGRGRRLAVRCFQDARVTRSERRQWPMFEGEGSLAWIPGVCRSSLLLPAAGTPALRIDVEPRG